MAPERELDPSAGGRVLDRVLDEVRQDLPQHVGVGGDLGEVVSGRQLDRHAGRRVGAGRLDDLERERCRVAVLDGEGEAARVEPARCEHLVDDPRQAVRLPRDHGQEPPSMVFVEVDVLAPKRHRSAVDGRERRSQLVRDRGHELALEPLDAPLLGQVAERIDRPVRELDGGDRDPELAVAQVERQRLGVLGRVGGGARDRDERLDRRPPGQNVLRPAPEDVVAARAQ